MKIKILNLLLVVTSLFGYLEWGGTSNHIFLVEGEYQVLTKIFTDPQSVLHPFTLIPLLGQILLVFTLFQTTPGTILTAVGTGCLGLLIGFMFFIGLIGLNFKILISTFPFIITAMLVIKELRKRKNERARR